MIQIRAKVSLYIIHITPTVINQINFEYVQVEYGALYDLCVGEFKRETIRHAQPGPFSVFYL